jgi:hypothetical protein
MIFLSNKVIFLTKCGGKNNFGMPEPRISCVKVKYCLMVFNSIAFSWSRSLHSFSHDKLFYIFVGIKLLIIIQHGISLRRVMASHQSSSIPPSQFRVSKVQIWHFLHVVSLDIILKKLKLLYLYRYVKL